MKISFLLITLLLSNFSFATANNWKSIKVEWMWMPAEATECYWMNATIRSDGTFKTKSCGKKRSGTIAPEAFAKVEKLMAEVLKSQDAKLECSENATQDYSWDYKIKTNLFKKAKTYYKNDGRKECYRGVTAQNDLFNDFDIAVSIAVDPVLNEGNDEAKTQ